MVASSRRGAGEVEAATSLGRHEAVVRAALDEARAAHLAGRIGARDPSVWASEPAVQRSIAERLGWLEVVPAMRERVGEMVDLRRALRAAGYQHAVLLGMGGSSLAPETLARTFGRQDDGLDLLVLDSTAPEAVRAVDEAIDPSRTVFLVATKSGTTVETLSFARYFEARVRALGVADPAPHFVAITDPGTPLDAQAKREGWRAVFLNPPDIGGRYSALSLFGLVPAALLGLDVVRLLDEADRAAAAPDPVDQGLAGFDLGVSLGALARTGVDKVTLVLPPPIASFGAWMEQLLAESTGKNGTGLVPIDGEPPEDPSVYDADRVFVQLRLSDAPDPVTDAELDACAAAGFPVLRYTIQDPYELGGEFLRWEGATAVAGALLGVNPFDEPNVTESKDTTRAMLAEAARDGRLPRSAAVVSDDALEIHADVETASALAAAIAERGDDRADPAAWLRGFLDATHSGDYVALLAFVRSTPERDAVLTRARTSIRERFRRATTAGYGPRYLHSTGQLHKGGPNTGVFLLLTAADTAASGDVAIPGESYTFGLLRDAQAIGDLMVLRRRGRRALHVHASGDADAAVAALADAIERAGAAG